MRIRPVITVLAMSGLLAAALIRCSLQPLPPGPQVLGTRERFARGAVVSLPPGRAVDVAALVASFKEARLSTVILRASADSSGERIEANVALAIDLQRELDADVLIGTYERDAQLGSPSMETLLAVDRSFLGCHPNSGLRLDSSDATIDKMRRCSQDVSRQIAEALVRRGASARIGCHVPDVPELVDNATDDERAKIGAFLREAASPCVEARRPVSMSPLLTARGSNPGRAGLLLRDSLADSGVAVVMLQDGVGADTTHPLRGGPYFDGVRSATVDRVPVQIWASVEAFECESPACTKTRPTSRARLIDQLCAARSRVDGIVITEYAQHFAGRSLLVASPGTPDASDAGSSAEEQAIDSNIDAAAVLRKDYLEWRDAGGPCAR